MRVLDSINRKALGIGCAVAIAVLVAGLSVFGLDPGDNELGLIFGLAWVAGLAAALIVIVPDK